MSDFSGKLCPYCKSGFTEDDEVVVCSACDMPHHKDCWIENQGCTTFGCMGTINAASGNASTVTATQLNYDDNTAETVQDSKYCPRFGARNQSTSLFCFSCGNRFPAPAQEAGQPAAEAQSTPVYTQDFSNNSGYAVNTQPYSGASGYQNYANPQYGAEQNRTYMPQGAAQGGYAQNQPYCQPAADESDIQRLVDVNAEYYMPKFREIRMQGKQTTWNWSAFLAGSGWLFYRKMYVYGGVLLALEIIFSMLGSGVMSVLSVCAGVALGLMGNTFYMKYLEGKASGMKQMAEPYKTQFVSANGGVNMTAAILSGAGRALMVFIFMMIRG